MNSDTERRQDGTELHRRSFHVEGTPLFAPRSFLPWIRGVYQHDPAKGVRFMAASIPELPVGVATAFLEGIVNLTDDPDPEDGGTLELPDDWMDQLAAIDDPNG